ncbi:MAG: MBOAT family protein [Candidatus Zixiibacteriota bacterium]
MLFNSFEFAIFFPVILVLYWLLSLRYQNILLLVGSYFFYGYWDWRFLSLIALSTIIDYFAGLKIEQAHQAGPAKSEKKKQFWLLTSIFANLGILGFFKYFNFFVDSFAALLGAAGVNSEGLYLNIILPVGISFYTFQTMSYTIDVYRGIMKPTRSLLGFAVYVAFFPQLVAGPIERAKNLLPRILGKRQFNLDQFFEGTHLILLGLFKKVYVADNLAPYVDSIFASASHTGFEVIAGAYLFAFQIYCDFSGYSDIARGCAKCMGIELMVNFRYPYVAVNPSDFWKRWHISLSSWLADYLYIPLGGNRKGDAATYRNLSLTMLLGGLWHGASWVFVLWGAYQGALLIGHRLLKSLFSKLEGLTGVVPAAVKKTLKIFIMFQFVCVGWIIFRAESMSQIREMTSALLYWQGRSDLTLLKPLVQFALPLVLFEVLYTLVTKNEWANFQKVPTLVKSAAYAVVFYLLTFYAARAESFIYFQF